MAPFTSCDAMLSLNDDTVRTFLRCSRIVQVATLSPKGRPFMTPLWFVVHREVLYITTGPASWAGKNVAQHPDVALLFSDERGGQPGRVLRLRGSATCHNGFPSWAVLLRVAAKYYVSPSALPVELRNWRKWRLRNIMYASNAGGVGYIRVVPNSAEILVRP